MKKIIIILFTALSCQTIFGAQGQDSLWLRSSGDEKSTKYTSQNQINIVNIKNLKKEWIFNTGIKGVSEATPIFNGKFLFASSGNSLFALDPLQGKKIWSKVFSTTIAKRGMVYFNDNIYVPSGSGVIVINPENGEKIKTIGSETSLIPPVFSKENIIIANYTSIESWNIKKNNKNWTFSLKKDNERSTGRVWSGMTLDKESNLIFVATANSGWIADEDFGDGGYSNSVLAIDADSGKLVWQFKEIIHDLWDLDIVGQPILTSVLRNGVDIPVVVAFSKQGNTLILDRITGKLIYGFEYENFPQSHNEDIFASRKQINITKPEPMLDMVFDLQNDITDISKEKEEYVRFKLRNAKSGKFLPVSTKNDVVYYGLHGGAQWPGGALVPNKSIVVVPSNKTPWILRSYPKAKSERKISSLVKKNKSYMNKCVACHGNDLNGGFLWEAYDDLYFPELLDITTKLTKEDLISIENFKKSHRYISQIKKADNLLPHPNGATRLFNSIINNDKYELSWLAKLLGNKYSKKIIKLFPSSKSYFYGEKIDYMNIDFEELVYSVNTEDLKSTYDLFKLAYEKFIESGDFTIKSYWQQLLDQDGLWGSKPPWGYLQAINLNNGKIEWKVPFGETKVGNKIYMGDMSFGGVLATGSGIIFATGTKDEKARAFDVNNGEELWSRTLPAAGSSPPMSYTKDGCQFIVFNATGGIFNGYKSRSDSIVAYKLNDCTTN